MKTANATVIMLALVGVLAGLGAQQAGFKRTVLQTGDISAPGREAITAVGSFNPAHPPRRTRIRVKRLGTSSKAPSSSSRREKRRGRSRSARRS